jgi:hypothetical protein
MRMRDSRATKIGVVASTKAQALRVILASPRFRPNRGSKTDKARPLKPVVISADSFRRVA